MLLASFCGRPPLPPVSLPCSTSLIGSFLTLTFLPPKLEPASFDIPNPLVLTGPRSVLNCLPTVGDFCIYCGSLEKNISTSCIKSYLYSYFRHFLCAPIAQVFRSLKTQELRARIPLETFFNFLLFKNQLNSC